MTHQPKENAFTVKIQNMETLAEAWALAQRQGKVAMLQFLDSLTADELNLLFYGKEAGASFEQEL